MIRGPVLPQLRESLWALVANHLDSIESGLVLAMKDLDCSDGQLGPIDGLARDANGAPVLVLLAVEADALLTARVLGAIEFLGRVGDSLATAIPEGSFRAGAVGRADGSWSHREGAWRQGTQSWQRTLRAEYFCPLGVTIANAAEGIDALKRGGHPRKGHVSYD